MKHNPEFCLTDSTTAEQTWRVINQGKEWHTLFIKNDSGSIVGSITDGDIRRGLLKGFTLQESINQFANKEFIFLPNNQLSHHSFHPYLEKGILRIPVLNADLSYAGHYDTTETNCLLPAEALIMAGGKGLRMHPLTLNTPKPLLQVQGKTILGRIIDHLISFGIETIHLALHHEADQLAAFAKEWINNRVQLRIIREENPLGTAGALSLVETQAPWLFMLNADLLTDLNLEEMFIRALQNQAEVSIAASGWKVEVPYALLNTDNSGRLIEIQEKPIIRFPVNAGIYLLNSSLIKHIEKHTRIDMPEIIQCWLEKGLKIQVFEWEGSWQDLGRPDDYYAAQGRNI